MCEPLQQAEAFCDAEKGPGLLSSKLRPFLLSCWLLLLLPEAWRRPQGWLPSPLPTCRANRAWFCRCSWGKESFRSRLFLQACEPSGLGQRKPCLLPSYAANVNSLERNRGYLFKDLIYTEREKDI